MNSTDETQWKFTVGGSPPAHLLRSDLGELHRSFLKLEPDPDTGESPWMKITHLDNNPLDIEQCQRVRDTFYRFIARNYPDESWRVQTVIDTDSDEQNRAALWMRKVYDEKKEMENQVKSLVRDALDTIPEPWEDNITDQVCFAIYNNTERLRQYKELVRSFGKHEINRHLGKFTLELTGLKNAGKRRKAKCPLISTYTVLVYDTDQQGDIQMVWERIHDMFQRCTTSSTVFPPTLLYNEGWLGRLIVDWFSAQQISDHPFSFSENAHWYSEALLPTAFTGKQGLNESSTHADNVIGHFEIGKSHKADLTLAREAHHFVILEAKMSSKLSSGVTNASYYDQAARNVACIAEVLNRSNRPPGLMSKLGFYVVAPQDRINEGIFAEEMNRESILNKVKERVQGFSGEKDQWYEEWFIPTLEHINIDVLSWEALIDLIQEYDPDFGVQMMRFYNNCVDFN